MDPEYGSAPEHLNPFKTEFDCLFTRLTESTHTFTVVSYGLLGFRAGQRVLSTPSQVTVQLKHLLMILKVKVKQLLMLVKVKLK